MPPRHLQARISKREAKDVVEIALETGESVKLAAFGNFHARDKSKAGEEIPISARRLVAFHTSQKLKAAVEKSRHGSESPGS